MQCEATSVSLSLSLRLASLRTSLHTGFPLDFNFFFDDDGVASTNVGPSETADARWSKACGQERERERGTPRQRPGGP